MSADEEKTTKMEEKLKDITDCCICLETYREPRILPCIHTFCMSCLEKAGAKINRGPDDRMPCPICRKEFTIPENGFSGLQKNFFMDRLVEIRQVLNPSFDRTVCDLCAEDSDHNEIPAADVYCGDCQQKLCQDCCRHHKKSKLSKFHKIIELKDQLNRDDCIGSALPTFCGLHDGKPLEIYCSVCQETVCAICFFESHKTHDGLHINNIVEDFREKIRKNKEDVPTRVNSLVERRKTLENDIDAFLQKTEHMEIQINSAREELKHLVDEHWESLVLQLKSLKQGRQKDTELQKDEIETLIASLESYEAYCNQITTMGSASDICRAVNSLNRRAEELNHMYNATEQIGLHLKHISLRKTDILEPDKKNIIGHIEETENELLSQADAQLGPADPELECSRSIAEEVCRGSAIECNETKDTETKEQLLEKMQELEQQLELLKQKETERERVAKSISQYNPTPRIIKKINTKMASTGSVTVTGLAILDNELFIATRFRNDIEVYDSTSYDFKRLWCVSHLRDPWDLCSCYRHNCLYIAFGNIAFGFNCEEDMRFDVCWDIYNQKKQTKNIGKILRVDQNGILQHSWHIGDDYGTLSSTVEGSIILTIPVRSQIVEYDTNGECLREINISREHNSMIFAHSDSNNSTFIFPSRAKKLPDGNFLVNYFIFENMSRSSDSSEDTNMNLRYKEQTGLCMINAEGQIICKFPGQRGSGFGELHSPWCLAVDKDMAVLVLERSIKRISLLNPNFEYKRKLVSKKHGLSNPYRICLDEENGRLLVANSDAKSDHVLVYDIKTP